MEGLIAPQAICKNLSDLRKGSSSRGGALLRFESMVVAKFSNNEFCVPPLARNRHNILPKYREHLLLFNKLSVDIRIRGLGTLGVLTKLV